MNMRIRTAALVVLFVAWGVAEAQENIYWVGGSDGCWDDGASWDIGRVPSCADSVYFDVIEPLDQVRVSVPSASCFAFLHIVSGEVIFEMGANAVFIKDDYNQASSAESSVYIAYEGEFASLHIVGGLLTDRESGATYFNLGAAPKSHGVLQFSEGFHAGVAYGLIRIGEGQEAHGELIIGDDVVLRGVEIYAHKDSHGRYGQSMLRVLEGSHGQVGEIYGVGEIMVGIGATLDFDYIKDGDVRLEEDALLRGLEMRNDLLIIDGHAEVQVEELNTRSIHIGLTSQVILDAASIDGRVRFDLSDIQQQDDSLIELSGIMHPGSLHAEIYDPAHRLPEVGSTVRLVSFGDLFENYNRVDRSTDVGDAKEWSYTLDLPYPGTASESRAYYVVNNASYATLLVYPKFGFRVDINFDGQIDYFDVSRFMELYLEGSPWANIDGVDGVTRKDIEMFIYQFLR